MILASLGIIDLIFGLRIAGCNSGAVKILCRSTQRRASGDLGPQAGPAGGCDRRLLGQGRAAALLMSNLRVSLKRQVLNRVLVEGVMARINELLATSTDAHVFAPFIYGELTKAGAPNLAARGDDEEDIKGADAPDDLDSSDAGPDDCEFGEDRLAEVVIAARQRSALGIREAILAAVRDHLAGRPPGDDIKLVVVKKVAPHYP